MQYSFRGTYINHKRLLAFLTVNCISIVFLCLIFTTASGLKHYKTSKDAYQAYQQEVSEAAEKGKDPSGLGLGQVSVSRRLSALYAIKRIPLYLLGSILIMVFAFNLSGFIFSTGNLTDAYGLPQGVDVILDKEAPYKKSALLRLADSLCKKSGGYLTGAQAVQFIESFRSDDKKVILVSESLKGEVFGCEVEGYDSPGSKDIIRDEDCRLILIERAGKIRYTRFTACLKMLGAAQKKIIATMVIS